MNRFALVLVSLFLFATGCVESVPKADFDRAMAENRRLAGENALLQAGGANSAAPVSATPPKAEPVVVTKPPVAPTQGPAVVPPPVAMAIMPPPAQPTTFGPPQNWAWLTPPHGCEKGAFSLPIWNRTDHKFLKVLLDGEELMIRGAQGVLPHLPPHTAAYVCLARLGDHTITGVAYEPRMGVMIEPIGKSGRFQQTVNTTGRLMMDGRQYPIIISELDLSS